MHGSRNVKSFVLLTIHVDPTQFGLRYYEALNWTPNILWNSYRPTPYTITTWSRNGVIDVMS